MNAHLTTHAQPDGIGLADLIRKGELSAEEAAAQARQRMRHINPKLNAIVDDLADQAVEAAKDAKADGPFAGVPTMVKDLFLPLQGARMTNGSLVSRDAVAPFDAEAVTRLKQTGVSILATTTAPEFGTSFSTESRAFGATRNPWSLDHIAGGSSGGSAAMVAARVVPFALANDGGGSIRVPASCCGIFGLKPSRGRVPLGPAAGEGWAGMGCTNVVSISVRDTAAMLDQLSGADLGAPYAAPHDDAPLLAALQSKPRALRIGLIRQLAPFSTEPDCIDAVEDAASLCRDLGHEVEETSLPVDGMEYYDTIFNVIGAQTKSLLRFMGQISGRPVDPAELEPRTRIILRAKGDIDGATYAASVDWMHAFGRRMAHLLQTFDILLTPTLGKAPQLLGSFDLRDEDSFETLIERFHSFSPFTSLFNASGQPAMSVPLTWSAAGLPSGAHFAAPFGGEATLLNLAAQLEAARPWAAKLPPHHAL